MEQRTLSGTDLSISRVVLGTMTIGSQVDEADAKVMIDVCLEAGVNMIDTANVYNAGRSEEILGEIIRDRRDEFVIATKVRGHMGSEVDDAGLSRRAIVKAVDASLRRLQTDYIDLYYLHMPDDGVPIEESLEALDGLIDSGKVRYGASSNYSAWQMTEMLWAAQRNGWRPLLVAQQMYNLIARRLEDEYAAFSARFDVSNVVYNPLAGGLLTGKHQPSLVPTDGSRFTRELYRQRYWNEVQFAAVERLQGLADDAGITLIELSFRWLLSRPLVDAVILGASSVEQLRTNLASCQESTLDADLVAACDEVWHELRGAAPQYNR